MKAKRFHRYSQILIAIVTIFLFLIPWGSPNFAQTDVRLITLFGPILVERTTEQPVMTTYQIVVPTAVIGPYNIQVRNGPDGSPKVTSARILVNGTQLFGPSDFKRSSDYLEKQVELNPVNTLNLQMDSSGKPGSRYEVTITGYDTTPIEVVLAEESVVIDSAGGVLSLPDTGEFELVEDATRPEATIAVRKVKAPAVQQSFVEGLGGDNDPIEESVFEIESDVQINTTSAVRIQVSESLASAIPEGSHISLFALVEEDEGNVLTFEDLNAVYDPSTRIATAALPVRTWLTRESDQISSLPFWSVHAGELTWYNRIITAIQKGTYDNDDFASGRYDNIEGGGGNLFVDVDESIFINVNVNHANGLPPLSYPFSPLPTIKTQYTIEHRGIDFGADNNTPVLAAQSGNIEFLYEKDGYRCKKGENRGETAEIPHESLSGYGQYGLLEHISLQTTFTLYAHLIPGSGIVQNPTTEGDEIARSGNSGCSSGSTGYHTHFEYWSGKYARVNPCDYFSPSIEGCIASDPNKLRVALLMNGAVYAEQAYVPGQTNYDFELNLTSKPLSVGKPYVLALALLDEVQSFHILDWTNLHIIRNSPPNIPSIPSPTDGEENTIITTELSWSGGDPNQNDTVTYTIYRDTVNPPLKTISIDQSDTIYDTFNLFLKENTRYYWQVVAKDSHGLTTIGPVWNYTTKVVSNWSQPILGSPSPRAGYAVVFDSKRDRLVFFGGTCAGYACQDTWSYDSNGWHKLTDAGPGPREEAQMVYDSKRDRIVLFGGHRWADGYLNDTWEFDGTTWRQVTTIPISDVPTQRANQAMAYDTGRGKVVMFGGWKDTQQGLDILGGTYEYDGVTWQKIQTMDTPGERTGARMIYSPDWGKVILFGGSERTQYVNDTWAYDGQNWTQITTTEAPSPRLDHQMAYDPIKKAIVLYGGRDWIPNALGETWEFDGKDWKQFVTVYSPPVTWDSSMVYYPPKDAILLFGGNSPNQNNLNQNMYWYSFGGTN